ncbi:DUF4352 domain-containing protein [Microbacteriaceae bacterium 4G12]
MQRIVLSIFCILFFCAGCSPITPNIHLQKQTNQPSLTVTAENVQITIQKQERIPVYEVWKAKRGDIFLVFQLSIKNHRNTSVLVSPSQFNVTSADGKIYGAFQTEKRLNMLQETRVKAYEEVQRNLLFEVPHTQSYIELVFTPHFIKNPVVFQLQ